MDELYVFDGIPGSDAPEICLPGLAAWPRGVVRAVPEGLAVLCRNRPDAFRPLTTEEAAEITAQAAAAPVVEPPTDVTEPTDTGEPAPTDAAEIEPPIPADAPTGAE